MTPSQRLREMVAAATPGPWEVRERQHHWNDYDYIVEAEGKTVTKLHDALLIAKTPSLALLVADMAADEELARQQDRIGNEGDADAIRRVALRGLADGLDALMEEGEG